MNPDYPDLHIVYDHAAQREYALLAIATIAFAGVVWLYLARFEFPLWFPAARFILVAIFFLSLALMVVR